MKRSAARARRCASSVSAGGMASPNITVRGLMMPPHGGGQPGTSTPASSHPWISARSYGRPQRRQRARRSEEHTSELQSRGHLVCRLLLEKKKEHKFKYLFVINKK